MPRGLELKEGYIQECRLGVGEGTGEEKRAEERREMTELKARRKRAPRSEKLGQGGDKEGREERPHWGPELHIKCSPGGAAVITPTSQRRKLSRGMGGRKRVGDAGREN